MLSPWWKQLDILMETCSYPWTNPDPNDESDSDYQFFDKKIVLSNVFVYDAWYDHMIHVDYLLERAEKYIPFLKDDEMIDFSLSQPELVLVNSGTHATICEDRTRLIYIKVEVYNYKSSITPIRFLEEFYIEHPCFVSVDNHGKDDIPYKGHLPPNKSRNL